MPLRNLGAPAKHFQLTKGRYRLNYHQSFGVNTFSQDATLFGSHQCVPARKQTQTVSKKRQLTSTI